MDSPLNKCTPEQTQMIEGLFRGEYEDMVEFAQHILGDINLADVAVQEAFIIALRKPDKLCGSPNPVGWLYNTVKNIIMHIERDRIIFLKRNVSLSEIQDKLSHYEDTYSEVNLEIQKSKEWQLLTQFYVEGYSIRELADKYNISEEACKTRLKRARDKLRNKLSYT